LIKVSNDLASRFAEKQKNENNRKKSYDLLRKRFSRDILLKALFLVHTFVFLSLMKCFDEN